MHSVLDITEPIPASSVDLISLDDLKLALGITDNSQDAQLQAMIKFQSRIITEYCVGPPPARFAFAQAGRDDGENQQYAYATSGERVLAAQLDSPRRLASNSFQ